MKPLLICIQYTQSIHFAIHYEHRNHPLSFTDWGKTKCEVQCGVSGDTAFKDAWRKSAAQIELDVSFTKAMLGEVSAIPFFILNVQRFIPTLQYFARACLCKRDQVCLCWRLCAQSCRWAVLCVSWLGFVCSDRVKVSYRGHCSQMFEQVSGLRFFYWICSSKAPSRVAVHYPEPPATAKAHRLLLITHLWEMHDFNTIFPVLLVNTIN